MTNQYYLQVKNNIITNVFVVTDYLERIIYGYNRNDRNNDLSKSDIKIKTSYLYPLFKENKCFKCNNY